MPSIQESLDAVMAAISARSETLVPTATPKDLVLLAKSCEALRGTVALQALLQAAETAQGGIESARATALAALATALSTASGGLTSQETDIIANLDTIKTTYVADMLAVLNSSGNYRIGDMWIGMFPDAANLPSNVWELDGSLKSAALCPDLISAWGLGAGQTPVPFIVNYNATNPYSITVAVSGGSLRLPNMAGGFLRGRTAADLGLYQADTLKEHSHTVGAGANIITNPSSGAGTGYATGSTRSPLSVATATDNAGSAETRPANYAGLWVVRKS